jgi:glycosyltransferase involved in cell wall biosynthesis
MSSRRILIGGPGTVLPRTVEAFLSWSLCVMCLSVSGYHYLRSSLAHSNFNFAVKVSKQILNLFGVFKSNNHRQLRPEFELPICVRTRAELKRCHPLLRYKQLKLLLKKKKVWEKVLHDKNVLLDVIRNDDICRRLVSLAMVTYEKALNGRTYETAIYLEEPELALVKEIADIYPKLLELPPQSDSAKYEFDISVIIPAYNENTSMLKRHLQKSYDTCNNPKRVEIIIVDAGGANIDINKNITDCRSSWGQVRVVSFKQGGGRGPCLNAGAAVALGSILTFLHLDTVLPLHWDESIIITLSYQNHNIRANSCAFGFGIDRSQCSETPSTAFSGTRCTCPPGISAVETTANIRTQFFSLPYGDQCLSIPKQVFDYLGGFPDQCLMEDYELVSLLRKRANVNPCISEGIRREELRIIRGKSALCSPRRWQKFGVLYVTYMNSKFVNLYAGGLDPDDLYRLYYSNDPPARASDLSPWEVELKLLLT